MPGWSQLWHFYQFANRYTQEDQLPIRLRPHITMADHLIGFVTGGISKGIAITSELAAGKRGKDSAQQRQSFAQGRRDSDPDDKDMDLTEHQWALQDIEDELGDPPAYSATEQQSEQPFGVTTELATVPQRLPQPVLIPQRRPGSRKRGFMKAYAPTLGTHAGVGQDDFLGFLNDFDQSTQSAKIFHVINMACFGIGFVPNHFCLAVSIAVGTANAIAEELQIRYKTNTFLDKANEEIFKPKGLLAMVMTWKPDSPDDLIMDVDTTNPTTTALLKDSTTNSSAKQLLRQLRKSSGTTTEAQVPECAPLIHPALDIALTSSAVSANGTILKQNSSIVNDYLDRRSQTQFATKYPNSKLTASMPEQKPNAYVNRYANPDHPVNNGSIFALLTGGTFDPIGQGRVQRAESKAKRKGEEPLTEQERHDALMGRKVRGRVTGTPSKSIPLLGKMVKQDVLYLVVVNLPTAAEVSAATEQIRLAKQRQD
jgi:hypothetical protein